ncbi:hypothetical protein ACFYNO_08145 [Kitasatospora sp. NPDC006697]|uniref:hypothetical protein n=1 Tax=Kitasatospora sp. NPDC006697 TaxID=3364020 RepID=UPI0036ADE0AD
MSEESSAAVAALDAYRHARAAAAAPRPAPAWYPPARGILAAVTYTAAPLLFAADRPAPWLVVLVLAAGLAFLAVHAAAVRPGGVLVLPGDDPRRAARLRAQGIGALLWGAGWLLALPLGLPGGAFGSGLLLGAHLWWSSARERAAAVAGR